MPAMPADSSTTPRAWPTANARAGVLAEVEVLDRERGRLVLARSGRTRARGCRARRRSSGSPAPRPDHAAVERRELLPAREDHPVARMGGAGIDAEDDHQSTGFCAGGRTPPQPSRGSDPLRASACRAR